MNTVEQIYRQTRLAEGDCWEWSGTSTTGGGLIRVDGVLCQASRVSYEAFVGPIAHSIKLRHTCGNKQCVNPSHLAPIISKAAWEQIFSDEMDAFSKRISREKMTFEQQKEELEKLKKDQIIRANAPEKSTFVLTEEQLAEAERIRSERDERKAPPTKQRIFNPSTSIEYRMAKRDVAMAEITLNEARAALITAQANLSKVLYIARVKFDQA